MGLRGAMEIPTPQLLLFSCRNNRVFQLALEELKVYHKHEWSLSTVPKGGFFTSSLNATKKLGTRNDNTKHNLPHTE